MTNYFTPLRYVSGADTYTVIDPTAIGGSITSGPDIYVEADYTGATDSSAILQAACDLGSSTKRRVVMGAGTIRLDASVKPSTGLHLVGQGPGRTKILTPTTAAAFYRYNEGVQTDIAFEHFEIDGSRQVAPWTVGHKGMYFTHVRRLHINNLYIHDTGATGLGIDQITGTIENVTATGCGRLGTTSSPGSSGIGIGTGQLDGTWEPLTISSCHASGNMRYGIFVERQSGGGNPAGITIMGCTSTANRDGFGDSGCTGTRFVACHAYANGEAGFGVDTGTYGAGTPGTRTTILGCYSANNKQGILLFGDGSGDNVQSVRVAQNTIVGNTIEGIKVHVAGAATCTRLVVESNSIYDSGAYGLRLVGTGTFDNIALVRNAFDGSVSGDIRVEIAVSDLLATGNDVRAGGGAVMVTPTGNSVTTGNFGTFTVA